MNSTTRIAASPRQVNFSMCYQNCTCLRHDDFVSVSEGEDLEFPVPMSPSPESRYGHLSGQSRRTSTSSITATFDSSTALSFTPANISGRGWDADRSAEGGCHTFIYFTLSHAL